MAVSGSVLIACLRYRDASAMVGWLCDAFGFERHQVFDDGRGGIVHAELRFANGMIMLGPAEKGGHYGEKVRTPGEMGGFNTGGIYVVVPDADAHYARAVAAGASVYIDLKDEDYGGRGYTCLDPEGYVWSFGTYNPWEQA